MWKGAIHSGSTPYTWIGVHFKIVNRGVVMLTLPAPFLEELLTSVLDIRPKKRLTAAEGKQMVEDLFSEIFCGNDFFRPKIGAK